MRETKTGFGAKGGKSYAAEGGLQPEDESEGEDEVDDDGDGDDGIDQDDEEDEESDHNFWHMVYIFMHKIGQNVY